MRLNSLSLSSWVAMWWCHHFGTTEGTFQDTMTRQVDEAVRMGQCGWGEDVLRRTSNIQPAPKCKLMNSKNEWFKPKIVETVFRQL